METGVLRLYRNKPIYDTHELAIAEITSLELVDGQPGIARYYTDAEKTDVRTILAIGYKDENITSKTIFDLESIDEALDVLQNKIKNNKYVKDILDKNKDTEGGILAEDADKYTIVHDGDVETETVFQTVYHPLSPAASKMPKKVGDIDKDTTAAQLAGRSISQILDDILFETIYPSVTSPSASFGITSFSNNQIVEVGSTAPATSAYVYTANRGKATITETGYNVNYAGTQITAENSCSGTGHAISAASGKFTEPGTYTWIGTVKFNNGENILDSKGKKAAKFASGTYQNPYVSGTKTAATFNIKATYPYFTNGVYTTITTGEVAAPNAALANNASNKCSLVDWGTTTFYVSFNSEAASGNRYLFDVPTGKTLKKAEAYSKLGGWQTIATTSGEATTHTVQGVDVTYTRYACATEKLNGAQNLRFTVG